MKNSYIAEFLGTMFLVLSIGLAGEPIAIGAMLMVMVYAFGHVSGAHYNPAITLAVWMRQRISLRDALFYVIFQVVGAIGAALLIWFITDSTLPISPGSDNKVKVMIAEVVFTFALATVVLNVATLPKLEGNNFYGLAIGFTVFAGATAVGGFSGGVFNPAVATGPMLADLMNGGDSINHLYIYLASNFLGGGLAAAVFAYMFPDA